MRKPENNGFISLYCLVINAFSLVFTLISHLQGQEIFIYNISYKGNEDIDDPEKIVLSCSRISSEDSKISLILIKEIPAYFTGQKDLSAVIKIAQDRVQKVLDERG